jgi:hypothetical protein
MLEATARPGRLSSAISFLRDHPVRTTLRLLPLGIAVQLTTDWALGATAEYFNAFALLQAWGRMLTGGAVSDGATFLTGQAGLGNPLSMVLGTILLPLEPAVFLALLVLPAWAIARRISR